MKKNSNIAGDGVPSAKAPKSPKRSVRFLVIYIILLFSVSAVFLVSSYFAGRNESVNRDYVQAMNEIDELKQKIDILEKELKTLREESAPDSDTP